MHNRPDDAVDMPVPKAAGDCVRGVLSSCDQRPDIYVSLAAELDALLAHETDCTANLANAAAAIYHALPALNWAGFYLLREGGLVPGSLPGQARLRAHSPRPRRLRHGCRAPAIGARGGCAHIPRPHRLRRRFPVRTGRAPGPRRQPAGCPGPGQPAFGALRCRRPGWLRGTGGDHRAPSDNTARRLILTGNSICNRARPPAVRSPQETA